MRKLLILYLLFSLPVAAAAQRNEQDLQLDSLLKLLAVSKEDTAKAMTCFALADWYETNNQDSSNYYLQMGRVLSESLKFENGIYSYYQQSIILAYTKGEYSKGMDESYKGLVLARKLKDSAKVVSMLNNIGIIYSYLGDYTRQLDYTLQVKNIIEFTKDSSRLAGIYHNLANCYFNIRQYRAAVNAAGYSINVNGCFAKKHAYINRAYATLAQSYEGLRMNDSSLHFYRIAISESKKANDKYAEAAIYGYLCNLLASMNRFAEMLVAAEKSLSLSNQLQSRQVLVSSLYNVAYANYLNNNNAVALKQINEAVAIATADSLLDELKNCYTVLSYVAAKDDDYVTSVWAKQKSDSINAAMLNDQVLKGTAELEKKYQTEKKDNEIKLQKEVIQRKNILNYILIAGAAFLLIISILGYRTYSQKQKLQQQRISEFEKEKQLTATEAVLKGEEQERTRLAKDLHDGLGGMLSGIKYSFSTMKGNLVMTPDNAQAFERSMDMLDSSIKEMRRVAHNMMPEALVKFGLDTALKDFCNDINQSGALQLSYSSIGVEQMKLEQTTEITIYRIVQELINNTMKHAEARTAVVQLSKTGDFVSITVEDDGKGFDITTLDQTKGIGWSNIKNRVEFLKAVLDIRSGKEKGTSVHMDLQV